MSKTKRTMPILALALLALFLAACGGETPTTEPPAATQMPTATPADTPTTAATAVPPTASAVDDETQVFVETVNVNKENGRVHVAMSGNLPDACTEIIDVEQSFTLDTNTFAVDLITQRPEDEMCAEVLTTFERTITLETADMQPGDYSVAVHGQTAAFTLTAADQQPTESTAHIAPVSGPPGATVELTAADLPADVQVELGIGRVNSEYDIVDTASTDAEGNLITDVQIAEFADVGEEWVVVVEGPSGAKTISNQFTVTDPDAEALFDETQIYLIALEDAGRSGGEIGCGDSVVPVTVNFEPTVAPLTAGLEEMFAIEEEFYGQSGLYNALHRSDLVVQGIDIDDQHATIALEGDLQIGGACDAPRVEAQLEYTARQYSTIDTVSITLNGRPLEDVLSASG